MVSREQRHQVGDSPWVTKLTRFQRNIVDKLTAADGRPSLGRERGRYDGACCAQGRHHRKQLLAGVSTEQRVHLFVHPSWTRITLGVGVSANRAGDGSRRCVRVQIAAFGRERDHVGVVDHGVRKRDDRCPPVLGETGTRVGGSSKVVGDDDELGHGASPCGCGSVPRA